MAESYKLIKANNQELEFNIGKFFLVNLGGLGNPDIEYTTQKSFFQDGEMVTNFNVNPRRLSFNFLGQNDEYDNEKIDWWNLRAEILSFLSPASGEMIFEITLDNHKTYQLSKVYPTNGLVMDSNTFSSGRNDNRIQEPLTLTAFDPIWRLSPIKTTGLISPTQSLNLVFPITYPIEFGDSGSVFNETIDYVGTWRSYPKITIDGPYNTGILTNKFNGTVITLLNPIATGQKRIIDLTDPISGFTVTDANGVNKINELNINTNFTQFYFNPDSTNGIDGVFNGGSSGDTKLTIEYYEKYLGI